MDEMTLGKARLDQWFFSISSVQHFDDDLIHNCNLEWQSLIKEYLLSFALITDYEIDEFEFIVIQKDVFIQPGKTEWQCFKKSVLRFQI